jgi:hypothetical protein
MCLARLQEDSHLRLFLYDFQPSFYKMFAVSYRQVALGALEGLQEEVSGQYLQSSKLVTCKKRQMLTELQMLK